MSMLLKKVNVSWFVMICILQMLCNQIIQVSSHNVKVAPLLLISFDGFRWDYPMKHQSITPNFHKMMKMGVSAKNGIRNVFETVTLPNHWTLVTGLFPESSKVYTNEMYDPNIKDKIFIPMGNKGYRTHHNDYRYYDAGGEPIWVTNQVQNVNHRSGSIMWFGGDNPVKWVRPTYYMDFDNDVPYEERVDTTVGWLTQEHPINLGLIYFHEPDFTAHKTGIDSNETKEAIKRSDSIIGYLFNKLEEKDMLDDVNIIVTADHGFVNTPKSKYIMMDNIVPPNLYSRILNTSPVFSVIPKEGMEDTIKKRLKEAADMPESHFKFFEKDDIPERWHYKHNYRVQSFIALADLEYSFVVNHSDNLPVASHGYDNACQEMWPFFMAMGPSFKEDFSVDSFDSVDVYPLMCHLLHLTPAPNNGSLDIVSKLLVEHETTMWTFLTYMIALIVITGIAGLFLIGVWRNRSYLRHKTRKTFLPLSKMTYRASPQGSAAAELLSEDDDDDDLEGDAEVEEEKVTTTTVPR